jgi:hypothetical protein
MRSPRKNTTTRARGPVTTSHSKPEDIARLLAAKRATGREYATTVFDDPPGLQPIPKLDGTTSATASLTPNEAEDLVRDQQRGRDERRRSQADNLWGAASR